jgi:hypothetical protein
VRVEVQVQVQVQAQVEVQAQAEVEVQVEGGRHKTSADDNNARYGLMLRMLVGNKGRV